MEEQSAAAAAMVVEEPRPPRFAAMGPWWSAGAALGGVEPCLHCHLQQPDPRVVLPFLNFILQEISHFTPSMQETQLCAQRCQLLMIFCSASLEC